MTKPWQLLLVDDHPLLRRGMSQLLELDPHFDPPWQANNGTEALALLARQLPDLVVLDLNMQPISGLDTLQAIRRDNPELKVVFLTVSDHPKDVLAAFDHEVNGYLLKDTDPEQLLCDLLAVLEGEQVVSPRLQNLLSDERPQWTGHLTPRERQIAELIAQGKSNRAIGEVLFISEGTAKVHVKNLMRKLGCHSRVEIAILVRENGSFNDG